MINSISRLLFSKSCPRMLTKWIFLKIISHYFLALMTKTLISLLRNLHLTTILWDLKMRLVDVWTDFWKRMEHFLPTIGIFSVNPSSMNPPTKPLFFSSWNHYNSSRRSCHDLHINSTAATESTFVYEVPIVQFFLLLLLVSSENIDMCDNAGESSQGGPGRRRDCRLLYRDGRRRRRRSFRLLIRSWIQLKYKRQQTITIILEKEGQKNVNAKVHAWMNLP